MNNENKIINKFKELTEDVINSPTFQQFEKLEVKENFDFNEYNHGVVIAINDLLPANVNIQIKCNAGERRAKVDFEISVHVKGCVELTTHTSLDVEKSLFAKKLEEPLSDSVIAKIHEENRLNAQLYSLKDNFDGVLDFQLPENYGSIITGFSKASRSSLIASMAGELVMIEFDDLVVDGLTSAFEATEFVDLYSDKTSARSKVTIGYNKLRTGNSRDVSLSGLVYLKLEYVETFLKKII
jgi:hypothetical protein